MTAMAGWLTVILLLVGLWAAVMVVGLLGRLVLMVRKPGWSSFVDAWGSVVTGESLSSWRSGGGVRAASEVSYQEQRAMEKHYDRWRALGGGRPSAKAWLAQQKESGLL